MSRRRTGTVVRTGVRAGLALLVVLAAPGAPVAEPESAPQALQISSELRVRVIRGREIELQVRPGQQDDLHRIAERLTGDPSHADALAAWRDAADAPTGEEWIGVPLSLLSTDYRRIVLLNLFPQDHRDGKAWVHVAQAGVLPTYDEGLWQVASWFTGRGSAFRELMQVNELASPELRPGQRIRIPAVLLHPAFGSGMRSDDGTLTYASDDDGPYAGYTIRSGEALYSAVVGRFTGRTGAEDVGALAELLRQRSDIRDLRDIPVGYRVKIPFDLLEPEFLPRGHPRRLEAETARAEMRRELARQPVAGTRGGLEGVLIVLDPGHGGKDLGTMNNGIWEHDYVYDVACRLRQLIERETAAQVMLTLRDMETGCVPSDSDRLTKNFQGTVLTSPPFLARANGEAQIAVNLRWYLANSIYRRAVRGGTDADRIVFLSLHADSRHPSLSGVMVYVPGAGYRTKTYGHASKTYSRYKEVREKPHVRFSKRQRVRSEAVSRELADALVEAFRTENLPVQPHQPVRSRIIRGRQRYVPAVIRGNAIPNKVLVEMVNLSNPDDAALLASATDRQRLARALQRSLFAYFGEPLTRLAASGPAE